MEEAPEPLKTMSHSGLADLVPNVKATVYFTLT